MLKLFSLLPTALTKRLVQAQALIRNPYCLGVRLLVRNEEGGVLLVWHSYLPGWHLPGGGVDKGEQMADAARRELREEAGIEALSDPELLGMFLNREAFGRDHIGLYAVRDWRPGKAYLAPNSEIVEARFFDLEDLPEDVTPATFRRLAALMGDAGGKTEDGYW